MVVETDQKTSMRRACVDRQTSPATIKKGNGIAHRTRTADIRNQWSAGAAPGIWCNALRAIDLFLS